MGTRETYSISLMEIWATKPKNGKAVPDGAEEKNRTIPCGRYPWISAQKKNCNWLQFRKFLRHDLLPKPKIYHLTYTPILEKEIHC